MDNPDRNQLHPAFILHRRSYSNSSLLLELFTPDAGRFAAIAKGVRSRHGGATSLLQAFNPLLIAWSGRGEVKTLTSYEANGPAITLEGRALYCGFYLNELIMRLLERSDPHAPLFDYYRQALHGLAGDDELETVLRRFELNLLEELGYGLVLEHEAEQGSPIEPDGMYHYELERGPVAARQGSRDGIRGSTLLALKQQSTLDEEGQREARRLMRRVLTHYLGERPLKSRELFRSFTADGYNKVTD